MEKPARPDAIPTNEYRCVPIRTWDWSIPAHRIKNISKHPPLEEWQEGRVWRSGEETTMPPKLDHVIQLGEEVSRDVAGLE